MKGREAGSLGTYPGVVELGLQSYEFAFFLVLASQNLKFFGLEGTVEIVCVSERYGNGHRPGPGAFFSTTDLSASAASGDERSVSCMVIR